MNAPRDSLDFDASEWEASRQGIGEILRRERRVRRVSIEEVGQTTRIPTATLRRLEADDYENLPAPVYTRGFVQAYARALGIDAAPLLRQFDAVHGSGSAPTPLSSLDQPERGRRFGVLLAIVILVILFTVALSIAARPRRRSTPPRLSDAALVVPDGIVRDATSAAPALRG